MTISLNEAKAHLRIEHIDEDAQIVALINAATKNAESYTGTRIAETSISLKYSRFGSLPLPAPLVSVDQIKYIDTDGVEQTLFDGVGSPIVSSDIYKIVGQWDGSGDVCSEPYLTTAYNKSWPETRREEEAVTVVVVAGYSSDKIPDDIRAALLLMVGHLYENREATVPGVSITTLPMGYHALLNHYKVWRV
jgi:hypothetical protein